MDSVLFIDSNFKEEISLDQWGKVGSIISILFKNSVNALPAVLVDTELSKNLHKDNNVRKLKASLQKLTPLAQKKIAGKEIPAFNIITSSSMEMVQNLQVQNIGLTVDSIEAFQSHYGEEKCLEMLRVLTADIFYFKNKLRKILTSKDNSKKYILEIVKNNLHQGALHPDDFTFLTGFYNCTSCAEIKAYLQKPAWSVVTEKYFTKTADQLENICCDLSRYLEANDEISSIIIQPVIHGHYNEKSYRGYFFTNDLRNGDLIIQGAFVKEKAKFFEEESQLIKEIDASYFHELSEISKKIRDSFLEIKKVLFLIEDGKIFILDVFDVGSCSFQAELNNSLELHSRGKIEDKQLISSISNEGLLSILHPVIDSDAAASMEKVVGGINGALGACKGRVYLSSKALQDAYEFALKNNEDTDFILAMPHTFAEEVKAIKIARGVLSSFGGYSSHAPVVARALHKISIVNGDIRWTDKQFEIQGMVVKEGEYITLNAVFGQHPEVYRGKAPLAQPDFERSNLPKLLEILGNHNNRIKVFANVDEPDEARQAIAFKAQGIGLCRTEHMFFDEKRLKPFVCMILARYQEERVKILKEIEGFQTADFLELFEVFGDKPITIRLLDAPLHEFIPKTDEGLKLIVDYMKARYNDVDEADIKSRSKLLEEFNPMLGHRGCRVGITRPEIYQMQVRSIMTAACKAHMEKGIDVHPKIMIPLVGNINEMRFIKNGKTIEGQHIRGIREVADEVLDKNNLLGKLSYSIGTMVELPSAAILADDLAKHAEFFSFGTNDLTQTTYGLSRDDTTDLLGEYSKYDIIKDNPFSILQDAVKDLISECTRKGKTIRPDLIVSLCGEHGADPGNITFLAENKIDIISCSPFSLPGIKLAIAKHELGLPT